MVANYFHPEEGEQLHVRRSCSITLNSACLLQRLGSGKHGSKEVTVTAVPTWPHGVQRAQLIFNGHG